MMFGSQALETAIGLTLVFFVLAMAASAITELLSQLMHKRADDLRKAIGRMVTGHKKNLGAGETDKQARGFVKNLYETSPIATLVATAKRDPSYIPAAKFAEGVVEFLRSGVLQSQIDALPENLRKRVKLAVDNVGADIAAIRAELEGWFDSAMERLTGLYKRWARLIVIATTVVLVVVANVDAVRITQALWVSPALREAVVAAAEDVGDPAQSAPKSLDEVAASIGELEGLGIPMFWNCPADGCGDLGDWGARVLDGAKSSWLGWLVTILLASLGAPFWYGLLTQLVSLRSTGLKPEPATEDETSMTSLVAKTGGIGAVQAGVLRNRAISDVVARVQAEVTASEEVDRIVEILESTRDEVDWRVGLDEALDQVITRQ